MAQPLTERECQVLRLICRGLANKEVAVELCISVKTVEYHVTNILGKLGVANRTQAVLVALEEDLLDSGDVPGHRGSEDAKDKGKPWVQTRVFPGDGRGILRYTGIEACRWKTGG